MTELAATAVTSFTGANAIGSVGVPLVSNNIKIVDMDTMQEMKYNQTGEIWISSPSMMLGYYKKPDETSKIIISDQHGQKWIRTGDLGHMTEDGLLFHEGRIRRIYLTAYDGQPAKSFPMLIEGALKKSPFVRECSVIGRKCKGSDNYETVAFIVKHDLNVDEAQIIKELSIVCSENVPTYMLPVEYRFIEELPHTPIGKIDFRVLEKEAQTN